jgi:hypothetical protein
LKDNAAQTNVGAHPCRILLLEPGIPNCRLLSVIYKHKLFLTYRTASKTRCAARNLALQRKRQATWLMKCIHLFPPSSTHLWLRFFNLFNPSKKNCFGCAAKHPSAANVASSVLENFLPVMYFLRLGREVVLSEQVRIWELQSEDLPISSV